DPGGKSGVVLRSKDVSIFDIAPKKVWRVSRVPKFEGQCILCAGPDRKVSFHDVTVFVLWGVSKRRNVRELGADACDGRAGSTSIVHKQSDDDLPLKERSNRAKGWLGINGDFSGTDRRIGALQSEH